MSGLRDHFTHGGKNTCLDISERVRGFHIAGSRGARVIGNAEIRKAVQTMRPTYVIIDLGTKNYDLARGSPALTVADSLMTIAHDIITNYNVLHVSLCSVLHRSSPMHINQQIDIYNNILKHFCDTETNISYHTHRGFTQQLSQPMFSDRHRTMVNLSQPRCVRTCMEHKINSHATDAECPCCVVNQL